MKNSVKNILIYVGIVLFFMILAYSYAPDVLGGKVINQSDTSGWIGMSHEVAEHNAAHPDDKTAWTSSMFSGMPTVAMYDDFKGDWTSPLYKGLMKVAVRPINWLLVSLIGAFLMFLAFGVNKWIAVMGAVAVTFCSYNIQIIQAGHNTKMQAIALAPYVIAALVFVYRSFNLPKIILGSVLFALAVSFQVKANHPQISYYLAIIILCYVISEFIVALRQSKKAVVAFFIRSTLLLVVGLLGLATNSNKLIPTYSYSKYTMRGGSELSSNSSTHNDKGLDLAYATAWSYGVEEMPNLLIPNFNGGSSAGALGKDSATYELLKRAGYSNLGSVMKALPLYWGPQPFTAGPMYMGAITIFLFLLGLCLCRGREKWWLIAATIVTIMLAWGSHFMWFTRLWFNFAPMYNKFRTVSMALVALQFTLPILGVLALDKILRGEVEKKALIKALGISGGISAGFCLLCVLFPTIAGPFTGSVDAGQPDILIQALAYDRVGLLKADAWRSFVFILLAAAIIFFLFGRKNKVAGKYDMLILSATLCALMVFDLWGVGRRYLNDDHFVNKRDFTSQFDLRPVDRVILEDPSPSYRVLDISVNTFNDSHPSYHHKCIGGYSPVKLQRYQDLIERYISKEISAVNKMLDGCETVSQAQEALPYLPITSMLNGRYIIIGDDYMPLVNDYAQSNAWFVDNFVAASTPDEEIALLGKVDLRTTAIIGRDFAVPSASEGGSEEDYVVLTSYAPNELHYAYSASSERAVIFSEIYYPDGWKLTFNGEQEELFRANWVLRGAVLPAGSGEIVMRFDPQINRRAANASRVASALLLLLLALSVALYIKK